MQNKAPKETDSPEELLDLVDEQDVVIGSMLRGEVYKQRLRNYRVVHALIINSKEQIWIPKRLSTKKLFPNGLDYSIAGHVTSGETYEEAIKKEASEEVNLDLNVVSFKEIAHLNPHTDNTHCFQKLYEIRMDTAPEYNPEDFSGYQWLTPQEIIAAFEAGESMKEDIPIILRKFYLPQKVQAY